MTDHRSIVFFDGHCALCCASVRFIIRRDRKARFVFAALQSPTGQKLLHKVKSSALASDSIILLEDQQVFEYSTAALKIARHLDGAWPVLYVLMAAPRWLRDAFYRWVARNRNRFFRRYEECWLPGPSYQGRFLE
jgi:predicted DCC family thiol-disulfide oxidoreductase YuxK